MPLFVIHVLIWMYSYDPLKDADNAKTWGFSTWKSATERRKSTHSLTAPGMRMNPSLSKRSICSSVSCNGLGGAPGSTPEGNSTGGSWIPNWTLNKLRGLLPSVELAAAKKTTAPLRGRWARLSLQASRLKSRHETPLAARAKADSRRNTLE